MIQIDTFSSTKDSVKSSWSLWLGHISFKIPRLVSLRYWDVRVWDFSCPISCSLGFELPWKDFENNKINMKKRKYFEWETGLTSAPCHRYVKNIVKVQIKARQSVLYSGLYWLCSKPYKTFVDVTDQFDDILSAFGYIIYQTGCISS